MHAIAFAVRIVSLRLGSCGKENFKDSAKQNLCSFKTGGTALLTAFHSPHYEVSASKKCGARWKCMSTGCHLR